MDIQEDVASLRLGEEDSSSDASDQDSAVEINVAFKEDEIDKDDTTAEQHLLEGKDIQVKPAAACFPAQDLAAIEWRSCIDCLFALTGCCEAWQLA